MTGAWMMIEGLIGSFPALFFVPLAAADLPSYITWLIPTLIVGVIAQFVWSAVISLLIYRMSKTDRTIEADKQQLHALTTKLVDERFRAMTHELSNHVQGFSAALDELKMRLRDGDVAFEELSDQDKQIELKISSRFEQLKDWIRDTTASREDMKEHTGTVNTRLDRLGEKVQVLGERVAVLSEAK